MDLPDLWPALRAVGVELKLGGKTGIIATPPGKLPAHLAKVIRANRAAIIEALTNEQALEESGHNPFDDPATDGPVVLARYTRLAQGWVPCLGPFSGADM